MKKITISSCPGFDEWRAQARLCLAQGLPPHDVLWQDTGTQMQNLFGHDTAVQPPATGHAISVPRAFLELARIAICHHASDRFALLYRILWALNTGNKNILKLKTHDDVLKLNAYVKAVHRDAYKIKAFLRFREVERDGVPCFVAWYEPEHYSLELALPFFQTRFKNMHWSIITPYMAAHWDQETLTCTDKVNHAFLPQSDEIEAYWLKYYASTFNPARIKKAAMLNQMPKKYWKNMPETALIPGLIQNAHARARDMIEQGGKPAPDTKHL